MGTTLKKNILLLTLVLIILPLVTSMSSIPPSEQNKDISLIQVCDNCTFVNVTTVRLPNTTIVNINGNMTEFQNTYNFTFGTTELLGTYIYTTCGDPDGIFTCESSDFVITATGSILSTGESIIYIIFLIAIIFTFCLCLYGATVIPFKDGRNPEGRIISINDLKYLKIVLIVFSYLLLMFIFGITRSITANYLFTNGAHKVFNFLYFVMFSFLWPGMVLALLLTVIYFLNGVKLKKALNRGVPIR